VDVTPISELPDSSCYHSAIRAREVFDVSGVSDTAIAFFALARACGATDPEAAERTNLASRRCGRQTLDLYGLHK
jgi:bifunctional ADP-heptose synthase (sugar kinase/adenylyltransferase)